MPSAKMTRSPGRPKSEVASTTISLVIESDLLEELDGYAARVERSRAQVIRRAVRYYLEAAEREGFSSDGPLEDEAAVQVARQ